MTHIKFLIVGANETLEGRMTPLNYLGVDLSGHTKTEACMALSSVSLACASSLINLTENKVTIARNDEEGRLFFGLNDKQDITPITNTVFDVMYMAALQTKETYPEALTIEVLVQDDTATTDADS